MHAKDGIAMRCSGGGWRPGKEGSALFGGAAMEEKALPGGVGWNYGHRKAWRLFMKRHLGHPQEYPRGSHVSGQPDPL